MFDEDMAAVKSFKAQFKAVKIEQKSYASGVLKSFKDTVQSLSKEYKTALKAQRDAEKAERDAEMEEQKKEMQEQQEEMRKSFEGQMQQNAGKPMFCGSLNRESTAEECNAADAARKTE